MIVQVKLFAAAKQAAGQESVSVLLNDDATVHDLRRVLVEQWPQLAEIVKRALFSVNLEYAKDSTKISADAEIACIPPVSGG